MEKPGRAINVHLGVDLKTRWVAYCAGLGKTPGAALKEAIEHQLMNSVTDQPPKAYKQLEGVRERKERFEILLTSSERAAIQERADAERCSSRRWIVDAIRTGLTQEPQFSMSEIDALGESNYQLLALGLNLNQIARRLNEGRYEPITVERIDALSLLIERHTDLVSDAIRASLERWSIVHRPAPLDS
ncbi:mobilization protein [Pseudomonas syringae]|uniref:plasmid mobilization relaxosome protein MobC n=1 Tax=Pseudomonas syringae TaxID=317 RepID=UPI000CEF495D|nr:plasmid mobilization relaxosome protein MobC [Pseudomonas syringae]PPS48210.1 mobilization protein [Pseudomonas syringae]